MAKLFKGNCRKKNIIVKDIFLLLISRINSSSSFYNNEFEPASDSDNVHA